MAQEWFTLAELRAADAGLSELQLKNLAFSFGISRPHKARTRIIPGQPQHELDAEFHISLFSISTQFRLNDRFCSRIEKLGICLPVSDAAVAA